MKKITLLLALAALLHSCKPSYKQPELAMYAYTALPDGHSDTLYMEQSLLADTVSYDPPLYFLASTYPDTVFTAQPFAVDGDSGIVWLGVASKLQRDITLRTTPKVTDNYGRRWLFVNTKN